MLVVALLASYFINTWSSISNVSACIQAPGCIDKNNQPKGKLTVNNYGFPATYKQTVTFSPVNNNEKSSNYAGYSSASSDIKSTNLLDIIIDVIFWMGLLYSGYSIASRFSIKSK